MFRPNRAIAAVVAATVLMNSVAFAANMPGDSLSGAQALRTEVKRFRAQIDSGAVRVEDAIDAFAKSMTEKNVTYADVDQFVRSNTTEREYQAFRERMESALNGINPEQLKPEELAEIVGLALSQVRSEGLSWSSCTAQWTGVAVVVAAVVVGVFAIIKHKSESQFRKEWEKKIADERAPYDTEINRALNWQTQILKDKQTLTDSLNNTYEQYGYWYNQYYYSQDPQSQRNAAQQLQSLYQTMIYYQTLLNNLDAQYARYQADPSLALTEANALIVERDQALADLAVRQDEAWAKLPHDNAIYRGIGIGAGLGAGVGAYLAYSGIRGGGCHK